MNLIDGDGAFIILPPEDIGYRKRSIRFQSRFHIWMAYIPIMLVTAYLQVTKFAD